MLDVFKKKQRVSNSSNASVPQLQSQNITLRQFKLGMSNALRIDGSSFNIQQYNIIKRLAKNLLRYIIGSCFGM